MSVSAVPLPSLSLADRIAGLLRSSVDRRNRETRLRTVFSLDAVDEKEVNRFRLLFDSYGKDVPAGYLAMVMRRAHAATLSRAGLSYWMPRVHVREFRMVYSHFPDPSLPLTIDTVLHADHDAESQRFLVTLASACTQHGEDVFLFESRMGIAVESRPYSPTELRFAPPETRLIGEWRPTERSVHRFSRALGDWNGMAPTSSTVSNTRGLSGHRIDEYHCLARMSTVVERHVARPLHYFQIVFYDHLVTGSRLALHSERLPGDFIVVNTGVIVARGQAHV